MGRSNVVDPGRGAKCLRERAPRGSEDDCRRARLARFEQLHHARQTFRDVLVSWLMGSDQPRRILLHTPASLSRDFRSQVLSEAEDQYVAA
jgi:hypothetical protein